MFIESDIRIILHEILVACHRYLTQVIDNLIHGGQKKRFDINEASVMS